MRINSLLLHTNKNLVVLTAAVLLPVVVSACDDSSQASLAQRDKPEIGDQVSLTLVAFNYTDHSISSYSADGAWGGNVAVSTSTSGGGGGACCALWRIGQSLPVTVHIRWQSDSCTYEKVVDGETFTRHKQFYSEEDVKITKATDDPEYLETHFFPDGHVQVRVTNEISKPLLDLPTTGGLGTHKPLRRSGVAPISECTPEQIEESDDDWW